MGAIERQSRVGRGMREKQMRAILLYSHDTARERSWVCRNYIFISHLKTPKQ